MARGSAKAVREPSNPRARRLTNAVAMALLVALAAGLVSGGLETFASSGASRRLALPVIYVIFATAIVWRRRKEPAPKLRLPAIWGWLLVLATLSTLVATLFQTSAVTTDAIMQAAVIFSGMGVTVALGYTTPAWPERDQHRLLTVLIVAGVLDVYAKFTPFSALTVPALFTALAIMIHRRKVGWLGLFIVAFAALFFVQIFLAPEHPVSVALLLEIAFCTLILVFAAAPRKARGSLVVLVIVLGTIVIWNKADDFSYLVGDADFQDVTLAQRGYETTKVLMAIEQSPVGDILGAGLGGVVNLVLSPDALTLFASGRDLSQVDDVHLLSSYFLLKLGLLGLLWLAFFAWHVAGLARRSLGRDRPDVFDVALLMFAAAGIAVGIPASTNFLANPLPMLALGILAARQAGQVGSEPRPAEAPKVRARDARRLPGRRSGGRSWS